MNEHHPTRYVAIAVAAIVFWLILIAAAVAVAQEAPLINVPIDTIVRGEPGDVVELLTIPADPGLQCETTLTFTNNEAASIHPGNGIIVGTVFYTNVEDGTFTSETKQWETNGDILVAVRLGTDGVFSGGFVLTGSCGIPPVIDPPPPTDEATTTTTHVPTSTTSPPPVDGPETGGGALAETYTGLPWYVDGALVWMVLLFGGGAVAFGLGMWLHLGQDDE